MKKFHAGKKFLMASAFVLSGLLCTGRTAGAVELDKETEQTVTEEENNTTQSTEETVRNGWDDKKTCYYVNGKKVKGVYQIDGKLYYFNSRGNLYKKKGLNTINRRTFCFDKDYSLKTGAVKVDKVVYYFQKDGARYEATGLKKVEGKYYYFKSDHSLKSGWYRNGENKRYYFDKKTYAAKVGWNYVGRYKYYFNNKGQLQQDVRKKLTKKQKSSYYIKVNRTACCVTVYAKDGKKGYTIPVVAFVCSPGEGTPVGTFKIRDKLRWHELMGPSWGQWCEHLTDDILFHSVFYNKERDNKSLSVKEYNKLGTMASHGCIRLTAGDAKWIYDNCPVGTKVQIYNNKKDPGPFDKPKAQKLSSGHTWDPTDPALK